MDFLGNGVLPGAELVEAAVFLLLRGGVFHFGRRGAGTGGENKGEQAVVVDTFNEGDGLLKLLLGLSGEAHDHIAGEHQLRHDLFGILHLLQIGFPVIVPVHGLQHPAGAGLEGQVQLLGDLGVLRHGVKELFGGVSGVAGHEADQKVPGELGDLGQQVREVHAAVQVLAIGIDVLTQKGDLLAAAVNERLALGQNGLRAAAALPAPDIGDNAIGAEIVAAVHDGYPGLQGRIPHLGNALGNGARLILNIELTLFLGEHVVEDLRELPQMVGRENAVHIGEALFDPVGNLGLPRHAAAQEDSLLRMAALGVGQRPQVAENPLLGVLPDGAGIHHHHVGPFGALDDGIAALGQVAPQLFGVCLVLLAAIGLHIGRGCPALGLPIGRNFITEGKLRLQLLLVDDGGFCIHWAAPLKLDLDFEKVRAKMSLRRKFP